MRIGVCTTERPDDVKLWSGTPYHMLTGLAAAGQDSVAVGGFHIFNHPAFLGRRLIGQLCHGKVVSRGMDIDVLKGISKQASKAVRRTGVDALLVPSLIPYPCAFAEIDVPIFLWSDVCLQQYVRFYRLDEYLHDWSLSSTTLIDREMFERSHRIVFSSRWAAETAQSIYNIPSTKISVIPFGANLLHRPELKEPEMLAGERSRSILKLLFMNTSWTRKRGDYAIEVARQIHELGIPVVLTIVGGIPDRVRLAQPVPYVRLEGRLDKSLPQNFKRLQELYEESHFLILPTVADCTPMTIAEACVFAVPSVTTRVGGIPEMVIDNSSGLLMDVDDEPLRCARRIVEVWSNESSYLALSLGAYRQAQTRLSWDLNLRKLVDLIREV